MTRARYYLIIIKTKEGEKGRERDVRHSNTFICHMATNASASVGDDKPRAAGRKRSESKSAQHVSRPNQIWRRASMSMSILRSSGSEGSLSILLG